MEWKSVSIGPVPILPFPSDSWEKTYLYQKQNELPTITIPLISAVGKASGSINYSAFEKMQWEYTYLPKFLHLILIGC